MVQPIINFQSILGPLMYGMNMLGTGCGSLGWWNVISGSGSCSELDHSSGLLVCISLGGSGVAPWAELFVALGILGLWLE